MAVTATAKLQVKSGSSDSQRVNQQTSNVEEKHRLNFASAKHLSRLPALEYARCISMKMRTNRECRLRFSNDYSARERSEHN